MSNLTTRDYAGMEEMPDGDWAQVVTHHAQDARLLAVEAKLDAILVKLEAGIQVQVVTSL